jgi:hypothetical protein
MPSELPFAGVLTFESGTPYEGTVEVQARLYSAATDGAVVWSEPVGSVAVSAGALSFKLGAVVALPHSVWANDALWLELQLGDTVLQPRYAVLSVPWARRAAVADNASQLGGVAASSYVTAQALADHAFEIPTQAAPPNAAGDGALWYNTTLGVLHIYKDGEWVPASATGGGATSLDDLTDVQAPAPMAGDVLRFDGQSWIASSASSSGAVSVLPSWPDAINCRWNNGGNWQDWVFYIGAHNQVGQRYYFTSDSLGGNQRIYYTEAGAFASHTYPQALQCNGKSIATLRGEGLAFDFVGGGSAAELASVSMDAAELHAAAQFDQARTLSPDGTRLNFTVATNFGRLFRVPLVPAGALSANAAVEVEITAHVVPGPGDCDPKIGVMDAAQFAGSMTGDNNGGGVTVAWGGAGSVLGGAETSSWYLDFGGWQPISPQPRTWRTFIRIRPASTTVEMQVGGLGGDVGAMPQALNPATGLWLVMYGDHAGEQYGVHSIQASVRPL